MLSAVSCAQCDSFEATCVNNQTELALCSALGKRPGKLVFNKSGSIKRKPYIHLNAAAEQRHDSPGGVRL